VSLLFTPDLSIGVDAIDAQHRELFGRANALLGAVNRGTGSAETFRTLAFLGEYILDHFGMEERLMATSGYPAASKHRAEHVELIEAYERLRHRFARTGADTPLRLELEGVLGDWLVRHVRVTDAQLGRWLIVRR